MDHCLIFTHIHLIVYTTFVARIQDFINKYVECNNDVSIKWIAKHIEGNKILLNCFYGIAFFIFHTCLCILQNAVTKDCSKLGSNYRSVCIVYEVKWKCLVSFLENMNLFNWYFRFINVIGYRCRYKLGINDILQTEICIFQKRYYRNNWTCLNCLLFLFLRKNAR